MGYREYSVLANDFMKIFLFLFHSILQLPLPTKRVFAENALAHPSICITLIAPVKFDV